MCTAVQSHKYTDSDQTYYNKLKLAQIRLLEQYFPDIELSLTYCYSMNY